MGRIKKPRATVRQHGRQWYVRFKIDKGDLIQKPVGSTEEVTRAEAQRAADAIIDEAYQLYVRSRNGRPRIENIFDRYEERASSRSIDHQLNLVRFRMRLEEFFGTGRDYRTITQADVEAWRDWLLHDAKRRDTGKGDTGLSPKTVKEHIDWLAAVYNAAGLANPARGVERPRKSEAERQEALEFFTPDEMRRLFSVCKAERPGWMNPFTALAFTGGRVAEVQGIRPEHLEHDRRALWVTGKGSKRRQLILTGAMEPAWNAIIAEWRENPRLDGFIFKQGPTYFRKIVERLARLSFGENEDGSPTKHGHPHMLRHTFATHALVHWNPTWPIARLAKWLGHEDIGVTFRIYGHFVQADPLSGYDLGPEKYKTNTAEFSDGLSQINSVKRVVGATGFEAVAEQAEVEEIQ